MVRMPVATLRIWERRYGLTGPAQSAGGQRLYSAADVRRLTLLKQLTDLGHAIGSLAPLDMPQLQRVAALHAQAMAASQPGARAAPARPAPARPWRLAVVGVALASRLQRPALLRRLGRPLVLLGPYADLAQAAAALQGAEVDAVLMHEPQLQPGWLESLAAAAPSLARLPKAVFYGFAADPVCEALAAAGTALLREPQPDAVLAQWLHQLSLAAPTTAAPGRGASDAAAAPGAPPPRRWDAAALVGFAGLPSTVACECPRHVAELLAQLSAFEDYSAACAHRNTADAELHAHLQQVAAVARTLFEAALEHVALHEGLMLPLAAGVGSAAGSAVGSDASSAAAAAPAARPGRRG
jgi:hypothetical protein